MILNIANINSYYKIIIIYVKRTGKHYAFRVYCFREIKNVNFLTRFVFFNRKIVLIFPVYLSLRFCLKLAKWCPRIKRY